MYSYGLLERGCYYLVQEKEHEPVNLIKVNMETDYCMFVARYLDTVQMEWRRKTDPIFDILELVSEEKIKDWESIYNDNQDTYNYEEDD